MSSGLKLRNEGARATKRRRSSAVGPAVGLDSLDGTPGDFRWNSSQVYAIEQLFESNPSISSAVTVLHGQLLSGGLVLTRDGKPVDLQPAFETLLDNVWVPFAARVVDSFLKFGLCVVSYEEDDDSAVQRSLRRRRRLTEEPPEPKGKKQKPPETPAEPKNLIPVVPHIDTYDVAFKHAGRLGYTRKYFVYSSAPSASTKVDEEARVYVKNHPDVNGNVSSPMTVVFDDGSFVSALTDLALQAEVSNTRPRVWTQQRAKQTGASTDANLFFDTESRNIQASQDGEDNAASMQQLNMQARMCNMINQLQTTNPNIQMNSFSGGQSQIKHVPPEVPPSLFCLPKDQETAATAGQMPQARGDLESLTRLSIEKISAAFGVPSDLMFQGRFSGKTTSQLALLNTTVSQLAKSVNLVLTESYRDLYGEQGDVQLTLLTAPLAASEEVIQLYNAGLAPLEIAMPACLHAIGASKTQIDAAVEDAVKERDEKRRQGEEDRLALVEARNKPDDATTEATASAATSPKRGSATDAADGKENDANPDANPDAKEDAAKKKKSDDDSDTE